MFAHLHLLKYYKAQKNRKRKINIQKRKDFFQVFVEGKIKLI